MKTLVLRLAGPMQSWGTQSRYTHRDTGDYPTFSGVVGLVSAALGRTRGSDPSDLTALDMAVRVDRAGCRMSDFHTAADSKGVSQLSRREYLADAKFTVALTGADDLVDRLARAVAKPKFQLGLGRRSCVPAEPVFRGVVAGDADAAFAEFDPDPAATIVRTVHGGEAATPDTFVVWDIPYTRAGRWHYRPRTVSVEHADRSGVVPTEIPALDPFSIAI